jgi:poly-gamma-glutamate capsule biosynthesis protein CapA/YwtB (metallophosphatase superfamily)
VTGPITLALTGDTMLGRGVGEVLERSGPGLLLSDEVVDAAAQADLFLLNLECCISDRGEPWPAPDKPFFFRAPPKAAEVLAGIGVQCVTLANNHALDYGENALLDTFSHLSDAGVRWVGAGPDVERARAPAILQAGGVRVAVIGLTDHPADFAVTDSRAGVAFADLRSGVPEWLTSAIRDAAIDSDAVVVTPHWGPNMAPDPVPHVLAAADSLQAAGATVIAGHSAHVFQGVSFSSETCVLFDLGEFLDDYMVDPVLRNDLGLLFFVTLDGGRPARVEALPLKLEYSHTRLAIGDDASWIAERFRSACAALGTDVREERGRLVIDLER